MGHSEPLLLVDNQQAQVFKHHIFGENPVRSDENIHHALFQIFQGLFLLRRSAEPGHEIHPHRKILHALGECIVNLLGQNGGGHQVNHLTALLNLLERGPQGHLRLSVAHISADQAVHDFPALHIPLRGLDGFQLIFRLLIGEHFLKFPLPHRIRTALKAVGVLPGGVELHQIFGDLPYRAFDFRLRLIPLLSPQPV